MSWRFGARNGVSMGPFAASTLQQPNAVAIGAHAGRHNQGANSIAIGANAGHSNQHQSTIVINASGSAINTQQNNSSYLAPVRLATAPHIMSYNAATKEVTYSDNISGSLGIGTATVSAKLHAYGDAIISDTPLYKQATTTIAKSGGSASLAIVSGNESSDAILYLGTPHILSTMDGSNSAYKTAIIADGNGSWSTADLHFCLNGTTGNGTNSYTYNATVTDSKMVIKTNGRVGIGLTNPGYTLDVNGNVYASGINYIRRWSTAGDVRTGVAPNAQSDSTMSYYFGTYTNNGSGNFADLVILNGWTDNSAGNVNMIAFQKNAKGIRQYQGTHGSASNFSAWYDCVMTDANSANVTLSGTVGITSNNVLELGSGVSGKEGNAGKIGYQSYTTGCLDVIGAGSSNSDRRVRVWDKLGVGVNPTNAIFEVAGTSYLSGKTGIGITNTTATLGITNLSADYVGTINLERAIADASIYTVSFNQSDTTTLCGFGMVPKERAVMAPTSYFFGNHITSSAEWGIISSGWDNLFSVRGSSGDVYMKGSVGLGITSPSSRLDIQVDSRSGTHGSGYALYVTRSTTSDSDPIAQFRHANGSQGISIGYATISASGSNQNISIAARGTGQINLLNNTQISGNVTLSGTISISNRLLGEPDSSPNGNFWMGLRGSGTEGDRLAIAINGDSTTGLVSRVQIAKALRLTQPTANRVLTLDANGDVVSSSVTPTTLSYLDATSSVQTQLNTKASTTYVDGQIATRVAKSGDTMTGTIFNSGGNFHAYRSADTNRGCILYANNADGATYASHNGGLASWYGIGFTSTLDNTTRFVFNTRDGNSSQTGTMTANAVNVDGQTASRALALDGSKNIVTSVTTDTELNYLSGVTSAIQTQLNSKASTTYVDGQIATRVAKSGDTMTGALGMSGTNFIEFGSGTAGKDSASGKIGYGTYDASALCIVGAGTSGTDRRVRIWDRLGVGKLPRIDTVLDVEGNIVTNWGNCRIGTQYDTVTSGYYLGMATDSTSRFLYLISQSADSGGSGAVIVSTGSSPTERVRWTHDGIMKFNNPVQNRVIVLYEEAANDHQYYGIGINAGTLRFNIPVASATRFSFWAGTSSSASTEVFRINGTGELNSGVSGANANVTPNLKFSNSASHIDNNAGEVYLFTGYNGHLAIGQNTTRSATTTNLVLGVSGTEEAEVLSLNTDNSAFKPMSFGASIYTWVIGNSTDIDLMTYTLRGQTVFDGSNNVNFQCQASQYGRNRLYMTGRYEGSNDAWSFGGPRNAIIFRTQSSLNSAYTNRWTIQNYASDLGFLSSGGGNEPRVVLADGGNVGIGTTNPSYKVHWYGNQNSGLEQYGQNANAGSSAYTLLGVRNNTPSQLIMFLNSTGRTDDGGASTGTIRNDAGTLRLQSASGKGLTIQGSTGRVAMNPRNGTDFPGLFTLYQAGGEDFFTLHNSTYALDQYINQRFLFGSFDSTHRSVWIQAGLPGSNQTYLRVFVQDSDGTVDYPLQILPTRVDFRKDTYVSGNFTGNEVYTTNWFRINANGGGLYWQNLGYGITSANAYDASYNPTMVGNVQCYGTPKGGHNGYNVPLSPPPNTSYGGLAFASSTGETYGGILHTWGNTPNKTYPIYINYNEINTCYLGAGSLRCSQDWDRIIAYANGYDTGSGYFFYNQGNAYGTISDRRIKKDFQRIEVSQSEAFLRAIEPTSFCLKESECEVSDVSGVKPTVCSCRQDGWVAQNVLEACSVSGASKSVINKWYDYEQEQSLPEEEQKTLIGVSDRPILSHTVNVVKGLMKRIEVLEAREEELTARVKTLEAREVMWEQHEREQEVKMTKMEKDMEKVAGLLAQLMPK